jgi:hypothetical protein
MIRTNDAFWNSTSTNEYWTKHQCWNKTPSLPNKVPTAPPIFSLPTAAANPLPKLVAGWYGLRKTNQHRDIHAAANALETAQKQRTCHLLTKMPIPHREIQSQYLSDPLQKKKPRGKANICMQLSSPFYSTGSVTPFWNRMGDQRGRAGGFRDAASLIRFHGCRF